MVLFGAWLAAAPCLKNLPLYTEAKWLLTGTGLLSSVRRARAQRSSPFPPAESGFNGKGDKRCSGIIQTGCAGSTASLRY